VTETSIIAASASDQISATSQALGKSSTEMVANAKGTSALLEQMVTSVNQNSDNSRVANGIATSASRQAQEGSQAGPGTGTAMRAIADKISVIEDIAYKTNL
jgi:methyl-accepting chemotaxis protein